MKLPNQFIQLIKDNNLQELFYEYAEIVIDGATDSELIDDIPIVGTLTKGGKFLLSFRDRAFVNKISVFLKELETITEEEKTKFLQKLQDEELNEKTGEHLLSLLDRLESKEKSKIVGHLFKMYVQGKISESWFTCLTHAIDKTEFFEFHLLRAGAKNGYILKDQVGEIFVPLRLVERKLKFIKYEPGKLPELPPKPEEDHVDISYSVTKIGMVMVNLFNDIYGEYK